MKSLRIFLASLLLVGAIGSFVYVVEFSEYGQAASFAEDIAASGQRRIDLTIPATTATIRFEVSDPGDDVIRWVHLVQNGDAGYTVDDQTSHFNAVPNATVNTGGPSDVIEGIGITAENAASVGDSADLMVTYLDGGAATISVDTITFTVIEPRFVSATAQTATTIAPGGFVDYEMVVDSGGIGGSGFQSLDITPASGGEISFAYQSGDSVSLSPSGDSVDWNDINNVGTYTFIMRITFGAGIADGNYTLDFSSVGYVAQTSPGDQTVTVSSGGAVCGNGSVEGGEICDDGASNGNPGFCNATCDGFVAAPSGGGSRTRRGLGDRNTLSGDDEGGPDVVLGVEEPSFRFAAEEPKEITFTSEPDLLIQSLIEVVQVDEDPVKYSFDALGLSFPYAKFDERVTEFESVIDELSSLPFESAEQIYAESLHLQSTLDVIEVVPELGTGWGDGVVALSRSRLHDLSLNLEAKYDFDTEISETPTVKDCPSCSAYYAAMQLIRSVMIEPLEAAYEALICDEGLSEGQRQATMDSIKSTLRFLDRVMEQYQQQYNECLQMIGEEEQCGEVLVEGPSIEFLDEEPICVDATLESFDGLLDYSDSAFDLGRMMARGLYRMPKRIEDRKELMRDFDVGVDLGPMDF